MQTNKWRPAHCNFTVGVYVQRCMTIRWIRWLPALLLFVSCVSPEAFHLSGPIEPIECPDDGNDWYFVDCPNNPECPIEPTSICTNGDGSLQVSNCIFLKYGVKITCVLKCEGETK